MTKLEIILYNVERLLKAQRRTANETGVGELIRNMRRKVRKGKLGGAPRSDSLMRIAADLRTDLVTLTTLPAPAAPEGDAPQLREFLLSYRALIDQHLAELDAATAARAKPPAKKAKPKKRSKPGDKVARGLLIAAK